MRVLVVKLSSLGDVIHTLPAITDAAVALPGVRFDWVVEEAFAEIPSPCGAGVVDPCATFAVRSGGGPVKPCARPATMR